MGFSIPSSVTIQAYEEKQSKEQAKLESANAKKAPAKRMEQTANGHAPPPKLKTAATTSPTSQPAKKKVKMQAEAVKRQ